MLPKCTHLWECKVNKDTRLYEHSNESIEANAYLILMMRWEIIMSYDVLMLEANFHDVWVECNWTLNRALLD